ncbi:MAG: ribosome maturation factor RimM [Acidimicrobiia bacterium]
MSDQHIPVGYVRRAHGIGGDVVVRGMVSDAAVRFVEGATMITGEDSSRTFTIVEARPHQGDFLVRFDRITDKSTADALVGTQFVIQPHQRRELDESEWWAEDIVGATIESVDGETIGSVVDVVAGGAQDRLVADTTEGVRFEIPFVAEIVPSVESGRVVVDLPDGLIPDSE